MVYFSNSSEGDALEMECDECIHADPDAGCPIYMIQMHFNYDQHDNEKLKQAMNMLISHKKKGGLCNMKPLIDKYYKKREIPKQQHEVDESLYKAKKWGQN